MISLHEGPPEAWAGGAEALRTAALEEGRGFGKQQEDLSLSLGTSGRELSDPPGRWRPGRRPRRPQLPHGPHLQAPSSANI